MIDLRAFAHAAMVDNGFEPDFSESALREARTAQSNADGVRDLRALPWTSIDNLESRDLDQVEASEDLGDGRIRVWIGIADVDALVARGSAVDNHALTNTTSVYTGVAVFNMLPEALSTDRTSLNEGEDRLAIVIEYVVDRDGALSGEDVYRALVHNRSKLVYEDVADFLEGGPQVVDDATAAQLRMQDTAACRLRERRYEHGALDFETIEARPVTKDGEIVDLVVRKKNRAAQLVEDFMIAANGVMARALDRHKVSSIRRVVRSPERWKRMAALASTHGGALPDEPSSVALASFLKEQKQKDPDRFAELSLSVVKLMGPGEYTVERAGAAHVGHFGLAVQDYTHSTAPNRRYSDLVTHRMLKTALVGAPPAYRDDELAEIASRCTDQENAARKVERLVRKAAAAQLLSSRIGETFDAIVTGAAPKGTFVRLLRPSAEGRVVRGHEGLDVGDRVRVKLLSTDPAKGFIDFAGAP
jgi:VacB/RNase II family 3'-5' exoribonuclease